MDRVVWVGASPRSDADEIRTVVSSALAVGFGEVVLSKPDESLQRLGRFSPILLKGSTFLLGDAEVGRLATIRSVKDEPLVRSMRGATKHVVVRLEPWKVIPLENLIAYFQGSGTRLLVEVHDSVEAKLVFETMEVGADGIFLTPSSPDEVRAVRALVEAEIDDRRYSTIVQNAETVRFVTVDGGSLGVSDLRVGSEVLLRVEEGGRHFGMPIRETISEQ